MNLLGFGTYRRTVMKHFTLQEMEDLHRSPLAQEFRVVAVKLQNRPGEDDVDLQDRPLPGWAHRELRERGTRIGDFLVRVLPYNIATGEPVPEEEIKRREADETWKRELRETEIALNELRLRPIEAPDGTTRPSGEDELNWLDEYVSQAISFREPGLRERAVELTDAYYQDGKVFTLERLLNLMLDYGEMMRLKEEQGLN